jgi:ABC-type phosphate/phosphonate transport system substrate-binding protein
MYFVPSAEAAKVLDNGDKVAAALGKATGLKFKTAVPTNYAAVIEAMGSDEARFKEIYGEDAIEVEIR